MSDRNDDLSPRPKDGETRSGATQGRNHNPPPQDGPIPPPQGEVAAPPGADGGGHTPVQTDAAHLSPRPQDGGTRSGATQGGFDSAVLLGEDHARLGEVAIREITPNLAIGISRGRFPKGYPHVDANEDAVYAATDGTTTVLVVADGPQGFDAARAAILAIADAAPYVIDTPLEVVVRQLAGAAIVAVAEIVPTLLPPRNTSRTALTIAAVRGGAIAATTIGDTAGFVATRRRSKRLGIDSEFLSVETDPAAINVAETRIPDRAALILTTDGFLDFATDPTGALRSAARLASLAAVEFVISESFAGGAGDNTTVAVYQHHGPG